MAFKIQASKKVFIYFISGLLIMSIYYMQMVNIINYIVYFIALFIVCIITFIIAGIKEEIIIDRHRLYLSSDKLRDVKTSKIKKISKGSIKEGLLKVSGSFSVMIIEKTSGEKVYFPMPLKKDDFIEKLKSENNKIIFEI